MTHAMDSTGMHGAPVARSTPPSAWLWAAVIVAVVVVAGAIGYAVYDGTTSESAAPESAAVSADSDSVAIVQAEIDGALARANAPASSVEIVNAEIEKALMGSGSAASSVEIIQASIDEALIGAGSATSSVEIVQATIDEALAEGATGTVSPALTAEELGLLAEHGMTPQG